MDFTTLQFFRFKKLKKTWFLQLLLTALGGDL